MKNWKRPELVILVRGQPQESVLDSCKGDNIAGSPGIFYSECASHPIIEECGECAGIANS